MTKQDLAIRGLVKKQISTLTGYELCGHEINFRLYIIGWHNQVVTFFCLN